MSDNAARAPSREDPHPNSYQRLFRGLSQAIKFAFSTVLFFVVGVTLSILVEWVGMIFVWPEQGAQHARDMLHSEIAYLERDFGRSLVGASPRALAETAMNWTEQKLEPGPWRRLLLHDLNAPIYSNDWTFMRWLKWSWQWSGPFLSAANDIMLVFSIRVSVVVLSLPLLAMCVYAFAVDGICQRENRKDGGGRESATKFHHLRPWVSMSLLGAYLLYLASPVATHPLVVLAPMPLVVGVLVYFTISNYKKFL